MPVDAYRTCDRKGAAIAGLVTYYTRLDCAVKKRGAKSDKVVCLIPLMLLY